MPDSNDIQVEKLFIYDPAFSRTVADLYIGKASQTERSFQKLIVVLEFPRKSADDGALVDTIIRNTVKAFEEARQFTPELILETTLESANILLPHIAPKKNPHWLQDLNLLIGISDRGQVHFSQIGTMQAYLAQDTSMVLVSERSQQLNPLKLFSHITSGILNPGDALLMTTSSLVDYIAQEKLKDLMLRFPPEIAVQHIESLVAQVPSSITFAAALVKFTTEYDSLAAPSMQSAPAPRGSYATQRQASAYAEPEEDDNTSYADAGFDEPLSSRRMARPRGTRMPHISFWTLLRSFLRQSAYYLQILGHIFSKLGTLIVRTIQVLVFPAARAKHEASLVAYTQETLRQWRARLNAMPKRSRIIVITLLILCFLLLHVLLIKNQDRQLATIRSSYDTTLFSVNEKKQAADAAMVYGDDATAEQNLVDMISQLDSLKPANKKQEDQIAQYRKDAEYELNKVRHINVIDSPLSLADISSITETNLPALSLAPDGSVLIAADKQIYRLQNGKLAKAAALPDPINFLAQPGDATLAMSSAGNLYRLRGTDLAPVTLQKHADLKQIDALTLYSGNLYLLDRSKGELFKHEGSGTTFKAGSVWLNDSGLLGTTNNFAIDGNVYLTTKSGEIVKLLKGARVDFKYHELSPALGANAKIYTTKESNLLYILDPDNKRIAILDKQGNIKDQYTSPKFDDLKDLAVNPQEDTIYVLNGKAIYVLAIKK